MPLPDLDWPKDLYSDVVSPPRLPVAPPAAVSAETPDRATSLWRDMVKAWTAADVPADHQWCAPWFGPRQTVS